MNKGPVVNASAVAAAFQAVIMLGLGMAVSLGWVKLDPAQMGSVETFVTALLALLALILPQVVAAFWARGKVTPLADPKTAAGEPAMLIPLAQAQALGFAPDDPRT